MKPSKKRAISILLAMVLAMSMLVALPTKAFAADLTLSGLADNSTWIDEGGDSYRLIGDYILNGTDTLTINAGETLTVAEDITLTLAPGSTLTQSDRLYLESAAKLIVGDGATAVVADYLQSFGTVQVVSGGMLKVESSGDIFGGIDNNGTVLFDVASSTEKLYRHRISGTGNVIKTGNGTLQLGIFSAPGNSNTYQGTTSVNGGILRFGLAFTACSDITVFPGCTLENTSLLTLSNGSTIINNGTVNNSGLIIAGASTAMGGSNPLNRLIFDANGGTGDFAIAEVGTVFSLNKIVTIYPTSPTNGAHQLLGWSAVADGSLGTIPATSTIDYSFTNGQRLYAQWDVFVCEIEGLAQYTTLEAALAAAPNNFVIKMLEDTTCTHTISLTDKNIYLDLNGTNLSVMTNENDGVYINGPYHLSVIGPGTMSIESQGRGVAVIEGSFAELLNDLNTTISAHGTNCGVYTANGGQARVSYAGGADGVYTRSGLICVHRDVYTDGGSGERTGVRAFAGGQVYVDGSIYLSGGGTRVGVFVSDENMGATGSSYVMIGARIVDAHQYIKASQMGAVNIMSYVDYTSYTNGYHEYIWGSHKVLVSGLQSYSATTYSGTWAGNGPFVMRFEAELADFSQLWHNSAVVHESNFEKDSGSTIITISEDYLRSLNSGTHIFIAEFKNGISEKIILEIGASSASSTVGTPQTGDGNVMGWTLALFLAVLGGLCLFAARARRSVFHTD